MFIGLPAFRSAGLPISQPPSFLSSNSFAHETKSLVNITIFSRSRNLPAKSLEFQTGKG